jgi:hypothetical protein
MLLRSDRRAVVHLRRNGVHPRPLPQPQRTSCLSIGSLVGLFYAPAALSQQKAP